MKEGVTVENFENEKDACYERETMHRKKREQRREILLYAGIIFFGTSMIVMLVMFLVGTALSGWRFDPRFAAETAFVLVGFVFSIVKWIRRHGNNTPRDRYAAIYRDTIGNAFSRRGQGTYRSRLLKAIELFEENEYTDVIKILEPLERKCNTADDYGAVLVFLASAYASEGMTEDAVSAYTRLLKYAPKHSVAWSNLGNLYRRLGQREEAIRCYKNAVAADESNAHAWNNLAQEYLAPETWEKAVFHAEKALSLQADFYQAESTLAIAYRALGNEEQSKLYFDRAVLHGAEKKTLSLILEALAQGEDSLGGLSLDHVLLWS